MRLYTSMATAQEMCGCETDTQKLATLLVLEIVVQQDTLDMYCRPYAANNSIRFDSKQASKQASNQSDTCVVVGDDAVALPPRSCDSGRFTVPELSIS
jgi:hypothetical protein